MNVCEYDCLEERTIYVYKTKKVLAFVCRIGKIQWGSWYKGGKLPINVLSKPFARSMAAYDLFGIEDIKNNYKLLDERKHDLIEQNIKNYKIIIK